MGWQGNMGIWYQQSLRNGTQGPRTLGPSLSSLFPGSSLMTNTPVPQAPSSQWSGHLRKSSLSVATAASQMCGHLVSIILAPHPHNLGLCNSCFICPIAGMVKASRWESTDSLLYLFLVIFEMGVKIKMKKGYYDSCCEIKRWRNQKIRIWVPGRQEPCFFPTLCLFPHLTLSKYTTHSFNNDFLSIYYMPGANLGAHKALLHRIEKIPVLLKPNFKER